jgi:hypothetical protein
MKRTSLWVPLAAAGVQLAALALCVWATQSRGAHALGKARAREALVPAEPVVVSVTIGASAAAAPSSERVPAPPPPPAAAQPGPATRERHIPRFITNFADEATLIVAGDAGEHDIVFGIFGDGNIRCVDVDNGCYAGKAEGSRARMREVAGSRAFTVQIEPAGDDRLEATFIGGLHDAQSVALTSVTDSGAA